jgi:HEAT repeat protein
VRLRRRDAKSWFDQHYEAFTARDAGAIDADVWWDLRVEATWGLISRRHEAVPFALEMLRSPNPDIREDGAGILAQIGKDQAAVDALLTSVQDESEDVPRDVMIDALGHLRDRRAIPFLAEIIRNPATDGDTRCGAVDALGRIARRRFDRQPDPVGAARDWLDAQGF